MAQAEDCASVLEQFVQDVANMPAEIQHLTDEIAAKDKLIQEARAAIAQRDNSIQKFIKQNGSLMHHPKEEVYNKFVQSQMVRAEILQDEKIALANKICALIDRHAKRLDVKMRELEKDGLLPADTSYTSMFDKSLKASGSFFDDLESSYASKPDLPPLQSASGNRLPHQLGRAVEQVAAAGGTTTIRPGPANPATLLANSATNPRNSAPASPAAAPHLQQRQRESSAGAAENKRRRPQAPLHNLPTSNLRQSSLGPGTPKAGTPGAARAGSAGPRATFTKKVATKLAPHQVRRLKSIKPTKRPGTHRHKSHGHKATPSSGGEEDSGPSDASDSENASQVRSAEDEEMDEADEKKYCTCRSVSYGDMIACDNDDCPYEWFHWACVGMTKEPVGKWYCPECRQKMSSNYKAPPG